MTEANLEYLNNQLKFHGFGEGHKDELQSKMEKGEPHFAIFHQADYGKDSTVATLQFRKSDNSDMYFFNSYSLLLKNKDNADTIKQSFPIYKNQDNVSLKEAYNLLSGRAVYKERTPKEGDPYNAWLQIDFKNTDNNGNYQYKSYNDNYGYQLETALAKHPIKELDDPQLKENLIASLQRGNRQAVTFVADGKDSRLFLEANPGSGRNNSLKVYDGNQQRIVPEQKVTQEQATKQEGSKQTQKQDKPADDSEGKKTQQKSRKGQRIK